MFKTVAMTLLALGAHASTVGALAADTPETGAAAVKSESVSPEQAADRAVKKLAAHLNVAESDITVTNTEAQTWADSGLGCGKPGSASLTVMTDGYVVSLMAQGKPYRVHASKTNAVICDKPTFARKELRRPANVRGLDVVIDLAREDLAKRLGVASTEVRLVRTQPQQFADSGLNCPQRGESVLAGPVPGYRMLLQHKARTYMYHTDLSKVRPCPAIETK